MWAMERWHLAATAALLASVQVSQCQQVPYDMLATGQFVMQANGEGEPQCVRPGGELREVRCCTEGAGAQRQLFPSTSYIQNPGCSVRASAHLRDVGCAPRAQTLDEAAAICAAEGRGARLCTVEELMGPSRWSAVLNTDQRGLSGWTPSMNGSIVDLGAGCAASTGYRCDYPDTESVWTGDACYFPVGQWANRGDGTAHECVPVHSQRAVICCSDQIQPGFRMNDDGCPAARADFASHGCVNAATLDEAKEICAAEGARLCTSNEMNSRFRGLGVVSCTQQLGCGHDSRYVWSAQSCDFCGVDPWQAVHSEGSRDGCTPPGVPGSRSGDSVCDPQCDVEECGRDGGDCDAGLQAYAVVGSSDSSHSSWSQQACRDALELHAVRCCSGEGLPGYSVAPADCSLNIWSKCLDTGAATLQDAIQSCHADGARICSVDEIYSGCTASSCDGNARLVWTNETCRQFGEECQSAGCTESGTAGSLLDNAVCDPACNRPECGNDNDACAPGTVQVGSHAIVIQGNPRRLLADWEQSVCTDSEERHSVVCCSDEARPDYIQNLDEACSGVWANSELLSRMTLGCANSMTLQEAADICFADGARLCSLDEVYLGCASGSGCNHDNHNVWTNEPCEFQSQDCLASCPPLWFGDGKCDPECDGPQCSFDGGDCPNYLVRSTDALGVCTPACRSQQMTNNPANCNSEDGCGWVSHCVVEEHSCPSMNVMDCLTAPGCRFEYPNCVEACPGLDQDLCSATDACGWVDDECISPCASYTDSDSCGSSHADSGCTWEAECISGCSALGHSECSTSPTCTWLEADDDSRCTEVTCSSRVELDSCTTTDGCLWDGLINYDDGDESCSAACRDKDRQIKIRNEDGLVTACPCKEGYYDSTNVIIHCWEGEQKDHPRLDDLNKKFVADNHTKNVLQGTWKSQCLACPDCIDCSGGSDWTAVKIMDEFGLFAQEVQADSYNTTGSKLVVDVFRCPMPGSCAELSFADIFSGATRSCRGGYDDALATPLCGACKAGYSKDGDECTACDALKGSAVAVLVALLVGIGVGAAAQFRLRFAPDHLQVAAAMLRLMWPRISQSLTLMITNYQIVSGLPDRVGIRFPPWITEMLQAMRTLISIDILNLPGLRCLFGTDFYVKFVSTMVAPLVIVVVIWLAAKRQLENLRTTAMPMPANLQVDLDLIGKRGSLARRQHIRRMLNFKLSRCVVASKVQSPYYALMMFVVYLRYPAMTRVIFDMFRCRKVAAALDAWNDVAVLDANYRELCWQGTHQYFWFVGLGFFVACTLGVPAFFLYKLNTMKTIIAGRPASEDYTPAVGKIGHKGYKPEVGTPALRGNPDYVDVAPCVLLFFPPSASNA